MVRKGKLKCKSKEQNLKESRSEVLLGSRALQDPPGMEFEGGLMIPYNIIIEADIVVIGSSLFTHVFFFVF